MIPIKTENTAMKKLITSLLVCLSVITGLSAQTQDLQEIKLQLSWKHQFQFAGYYMAKELGYYEEAGFEVNIAEYEFGINVTEDVVSGRTEFGVGRSSLVIEKLENKPIFLDVGTEWCSACNWMKAVTYADPEVIRLMSKHFIAVTVDRDRTDGLKLYVDGAPVLTADPTPRAGSTDNVSPLTLHSWTTTPGTS